MIAPGLSPEALSLVLWSVIVLASLISVEAGISVAIIEIALGVIGGNWLGLEPTPWITYLAGLGGIVLTFLAGAEVDLRVMRAKFRESAAIGIVSFLGPFVGGILWCRYGLDWTWDASKIAGIALSTTSLAVVYAVLVETGLTNTELGKVIMAACFITDFGTAAALTLMFVEFNLWTAVFFGVSAVVIAVVPAIIRPILRRYGERVIEPEIKLLLLLNVAFVYLAKLGASHAMLPAFVMGLVLSRIFHEHRLLQRRMRVVAFALIAPFFFVYGGMRVSMPLLVANAGLLIQLLVVKQITKVGGIYPFAKRYLPRDAMFTTLLMSTGLTMGTLSSIFGLEHGYIDETQFSCLVAAVVLSAIVPTLIAQKGFFPKQAMEEARLHPVVAGTVNPEGDEGMHPETIHWRRPTRQAPAPVSLAEGGSTEGFPSSAGDGRPRE